MYKRNIMITGGCGFIGSHVVDYFVKKYPEYMFLVVDKLTYCGDFENIRKITNEKNCSFFQHDICDYETMFNLMKSWKINGIIHLAAESHVDNSIKDPFVFAKTNVMGTLSLLHAAKTYWETLPEKFENKKFYHISTDEVYGDLDFTDTPFTEKTPYSPHSPYSASKASSDHFVRAYHDTYGLPTVVTNCSNNYGPRQFPEKLIPLVVKRIKNYEPIPVYGTGCNVRDWLYVVDHVRAMDLVFHKGKVGETYNIGGSCEKTNIEIVKKLIEITDRLLGNPEGCSDCLITYVEDRLGHDLRYAIDSTKIREELGWEPTIDFEKGLELTVKSYL